MGCTGNTETKVKFILNDASAYKKIAKTSKDLIQTNNENLEQVPLYDELEKSQIFWQTNRAILPAISIFIRYAYTIITLRIYLIPLRVIR